MTSWNDGVRSKDAAIYRLYAANCVELSAQLNDSERRLFLLRMAAAWSDLAKRVEHGGDPGPALEPPAGNVCDAGVDDGRGPAG
jgi:hypothetical protein